MNISLQNSNGIERSIKLNLTKVCQFKRQRLNLASEPDFFIKKHLLVDAAEIVACQSTLSSPWALKSKSIGEGRHDLTRQQQPFRSTKGSALQNNQFHSL
jgi:hypothetical protein